MVHLSGTDSTPLTLQHCVPCEGGISPLTKREAAEFLPHVPGWELAGDGLAISREWKRTDFRSALAFVNQVGALAEQEGHHPDISLFAYRRVRLTLSTHAIHGLSKNDFILAAKVNALPDKRKTRS